MTDLNIPGGEPEPTGAAIVAYTREAVDEYLHAIWLRRQELEVEITTARGRTARSIRAVGRLESLERAVGASLVAAYAQHVAALRQGQSAPAPTPTREDIIDLTVADAPAAPPEPPPIAISDPGANGSARNNSAHNHFAYTDFDATAFADDDAGANGFAGDHGADSDLFSRSLRASAPPGFGDEFFGPLVGGGSTNGFEAVRRA